MPAPPPSTSSSALSLGVASSLRRSNIFRGASSCAVLLAALLLLTDPSGHSSAAWARQMSAPPSASCRTVYSSLDQDLAALINFVPEVKELLDDESQSLIVFMPTNTRALVDVFVKGDISSLPAEATASYANLLKMYPTSELRANLLKYHASPKSSLHKLDSVYSDTPQEVLYYTLDTIFHGYKLNLTVVPGRDSMTKINGIVVTGMSDYLHPDKKLCGGSIIQYIDGILIPPTPDVPPGWTPISSIEDDPAEWSTLAWNGNNKNHKIPVTDPETYQADVLLFQQALQNNSCECTRSGYSGVSISDTGVVTAYGNTTFVGCGTHANDEMDGERNYCYVLGGTDCASITAQQSSLPPDAFTKAAYRECMPDSLLPKFWWVEKEKYWMKQFSTSNNMAFVNVGCTFAMFGC